MGVTTKTTQPADPRAAARKKIGALIGALDDEAFGWLACTIAGRGKPPIWPDGLGGFRDRVTIKKIVVANKAYVESME